LRKSSIKVLSAVWYNSTSINKPLQIAITNQRHTNLKADFGLKHGFKSTRFVFSFELNIFSSINQSDYNFKNLYIIENIINRY
jgi:hypothetical protein